MLCCTNKRKKENKTEPIKLPTNLDIVLVSYDF